MNQILTFLFITNSIICFSQTTTPNDSIYMFESGNRQTKWLTLGANYDAINSVYGAVLSNGSDEQPLIHFEEFSADFLYKITGQTDFKDSYSFGTKLSLNYPWRITMASVEYFQKDFKTINFFHRDVNVSAELYVRLITQFRLITKLGYQELNERKNFGTTIGLQKEFRKIYFGFQGGYYFDYYTYSAYAQGFLYKTISLRLVYDKIDKADFLNLGLHFSFYKATTERIK
jgi:hypothetical protein